MNNNKGTLSLIGYYGRIGGTVVPEFNATRFDLGQLIEMWAEVVVDHQWNIWLMGDDGQHKSATYAKRRIAAIADLIGEEDAQKIVDAVKDNFGKNKIPKWWNLFCHGATEEERNQMEKEIWAEFRRSR